MKNIMFLLFIFSTSIAFADFRDCVSNCRYTTGTYKQQCISDCYENPNGYDAQREQEELQPRSKIDYECMTDCAVNHPYEGSSCTRNCTVPIY